MNRILLISILAATAWIHPLTAISAFAEPQLENPQFIDYEFHRENFKSVRNEQTVDDGQGLLQSRKVIQPKNNQPVKKSYSREVNGDIQIRMKAKVTAKWGEAEWSAMHYILDRESGSNPLAVNPKSGACGIPQAHPCSKLLKVIGSLDNVDGQLDWMISYIAQRYSNPTKAMIFHQENNWY